MQATSSRRLLWDEENRLLGISDNGFVSQYWYYASGERTVKASFDNEGVYINGALSGARTGTSKFTAYVSPYLVVSNGGNYTKHVYMGSQRITSKVSNSGIFGTTSPVNTTELQAKYTQQTTKIKERFDSLGVAYSGLEQSGGLVSSTPPSGGWGANPSGGWGAYFYHPDHLGSSSLITDATGALVQHIQYVPFGEVFLEQRNASWSTPYKFNGKELDEETGLAYYHARYYDPRTSVWLSVDPLAEKYPNISSYVYCANNPVKYVDPDGRKIVDANGKEIRFTQGAKNPWSANTTLDVRRTGEAMMATPKGREMFYKMQNSKNNITITIDPGRGNEKRYGYARSSKNENEIGNVSIVIHEGMISELFEELNRTKSHIDNGGNFAEPLSELVQLFMNNMPNTIDELIAQIAGHEAEHATNKAANRNFESCEDIREGLADGVAKEIIKQTPENRMERLEGKKAIIIID